MFKFGIICGGPSLERGISLNSARSLLDHCGDFGFGISVIFVDLECKFYEISASQLYSNTPSDFDFKLITAGKLITDIEQYLSDFNLIFPAIHGKFGESGFLQSILEKAKVPFVGSSSIACSNFFDKFKAKQILSANGFKVPAAIRVNQNDHFDEAAKAFLEQYKKIVIKPISSGSSIGVNISENFDHTLETINQLFEEKIDDALLLEEYCTGREFTILVIEVDGEKVALVPTEIETSYESNEIFDYRKKYLPTHNTLYHTPPKHFSNEIIQEIRTKAEQIFELFNMSDVTRMDGWVDENGEIMFTDFNPISGMEQNSFLFRQSSLVGLNHAETLKTIIESAAKRHEITIPFEADNTVASDKKNIYVLFGGKTPERQVSLMSGTNVWLKLLKSAKFNPLPMIIDKNGNIWSLPYSYCLNHTVEEIIENCLNSKEISQKLNVILSSINSKCPSIAQNPGGEAKMLNLEGFLTLVKQNEAPFIFLALHGGDGEDGTLQQILEDQSINFNGSGSVTSALCMDKFLTGKYIDDLALEDLYSLRKYIFNPSKLDKAIDFDRLWQEIVTHLKSDFLIIKPKSEGCSAGIVKLKSAADLARYAKLVQDRAVMIPAHSFEDQLQIIELPENIEQDYIIEEYIMTDKITVDRGTLNYKPQNGWIELTVGLTEKAGTFHSLSPSITIAEGAVLSLEEKFQGGTGINITPPPPEIISDLQINIIKEKIQLIAEKLNIRNYSRIDIFFNSINNKLIVIEINSLPALTPSTVIFHQALAEKESVLPREFIENLILAKISASNYEKTH